MRTSRISKDTAKLAKRAAGSVSPPRRTTRSSLARFAHTAAAASVKSTNGAGSQTPDIEDSISPPAKKRRRGSDASFSASLVKPESDDDDYEEESKLDAIASSKSARRAAPARARARKPARKTTDPSTGESTVSPPSDWEEMYNVVRKMRAPGGVAHGAAVDTMGCERLADRNASPRDQRLHSLIALMLSSQTKDTVTAVVMRRLQTELPACRPGAPVGLNLDNVLAVEATLLNEMIWAVGFHNNKTKCVSLLSHVMFYCMLTMILCRYIKRTAEILRDEWNGDIPDTVEGLTSLPGVGPKMAYLCMSVAWNRTEGIGVDVHVHRITNMWGWNKTKTPEETRLALQAWLPHDRWREINSLLVGLGQSVCLPVGRRCGACDLGLQGLCKAADRKKVHEGRRLKEEEEVKEEVVKMETVKVETGDEGGVVKMEAMVKQEAIVKQEVEIKVKKEEEDD